MSINVRTTFFYFQTNLEFSAKVREEFYPELPVMHVVQPHLLLDLVADHVPGLVPVTPTSPPFILVSPGITNPDQTHSLPVLRVQGDPVEAGDGVCVTLDKSILVCVTRMSPVSLPGACDESLTHYRRQVLEYFKAAFLYLRCK